MKKMLKFRNMAKVAIIAIAIWLVSFMLPNTFSSDAVQEEAVNLKLEITWRVDELLRLEPANFTVDSWQTFNNTVLYSRAALDEAAVQLDTIYETEEFEEIYYSLRNIESKVETAYSYLVIYDPSSETKYYEDDTYDYESEVDETYYDEVGESEYHYQDDQSSNLQLDPEYDEYYLDDEYEYDYAEAEEYDEYEFSGLLSLTRQEFESMNATQIAELAYEGGYIPVGAMPNVVPFGYDDVESACPNVDNDVQFVTNVVVDGVVCVGEPASTNSFLRTTAYPLSGTAFITAWGNSGVSHIVLMYDIEITQANAVIASRPISITIESNTVQNTLTITSNDATNRVLLLGNAPATGSELILNNINFRRTNTGSLVQQLAASGHNIFSTVTDATGADNTIGSDHSQNWHIILQSNVTTGVSGIQGTSPMLAAGVENISGLIQAPLGRLSVTGTDNELNMFTTGNAGPMNLNPSFQIYVREFEMLEGSELTVHSRGSSAAAINIRNTQIVSTPTGPSSTTTVTSPGIVHLRSNAMLNISNEGIRNANEVTALGVQPNSVEIEGGTPVRSHGLYGFINYFTMEANSELNISAVGVPFRSRTSTTYLMSDGATKSVYAIALGPATNPGRPAFVLARNYITGTSNVTEAIMNRYSSTHEITITGEGTELNIRGHAQNDSTRSPNRANMMVMGNDSTINILDGAVLNNHSYNSTAVLIFGTGTIFNVGSGVEDNLQSQMNITVNDSSGTEDGAFRLLQSGSQTFMINGGMVNIQARSGEAGLLRAFGGDNAFYVRAGGLLEMTHLGEGPGIDFAEGNTTFEIADRFVVEDSRSEIYIHTHSGGVQGADWDGSLGTGIVRVEAHPGTVFQLSGIASADEGIFSAGRLHLSINSPLYFDFVNRETGFGALFITNSTADDPSRMSGRSTDLALWRNTRSGPNIFSDTAHDAQGCDLDDTRAMQHCLGQDPINGSPGISMHNTNFDFFPAEGNFANADLTHGNATGADAPNATPDEIRVTPGVSSASGRGCDIADGYTKCAFDGFRNWFNGESLQTFTGSDAVNNGWRQIRRMTANNAPPIVDVLRVPTDADQRIFGHVTIQEGNRSARSAHQDEVFVDIEIRNENGELVQVIYSVPTRSQTVFDSMPDDIPHAGVFQALVDFDAVPLGDYFDAVANNRIICPAGVTAFTRMNGQPIVCNNNRGPAETDPFYLTMTRAVRPFPEGTTYLPAGFTVYAVEARRTGTAQGRSAGEVGLNGITGATPRYRGMVHNLTEVEEVRDVTPPEQVTDVDGVRVVDGNTQADGIVTPHSTSIVGRGEPYAFVRIARVNPPTGTAAVTAVTSWIGGNGNYVQVDSDGYWTFPIPAGTNLQLGERLSVYISDHRGYALVDLIPVPVIPLEHPYIIWNMNRASPQALLNMANRYQIANIVSLPRTTLTAGSATTFSETEIGINPSWANAGPATIGNMGYHWAPNSANRTEFHDATVARGNQGFDYAYILTVGELIEIDFIWNYLNHPVHPDYGIGVFHRDIIPQGRTVSAPIPPPSRAGYHFMGWYTTPAGDTPFNFSTELDENTRIYARWLGAQAFNFFKTDDHLYDYTNFATDVLMLAGARFRLYRERYIPSEECYEYDESDEDLCVTFEDGDFVWDHVPGPEEGGVFESEVAPNLGRVQLSLRPGSRYRLNETVAPGEFRVPTGYWYLDVGMDFRANDATTHESGLTFTRSRYLDCDEEDADVNGYCPPQTDVPFVFRSGAWFVGNMPLGPQDIVITFRYNFQDSPNDGVFATNTETLGGTLSNPIGVTTTPPATNPTQAANYRFIGWYTTPFVGTGMPFDFETTYLLTNTNIYARWIGVQPFNFVKTDQYLYDYDDFDADVTRLAGAIFTLARWQYIPNDECIDYAEDDITCLVFAPGAYGWGQPMTAISDFNGQVALDLLPDSLYRLIETTAPIYPLPFVIPAGHWYIRTAIDFRSTNTAQNITITRSRYATCEAEDEDYYGNCPVRTDVEFVLRNGVWFVGNMPSGNVLRFTKTDDYMYLYSNVELNTILGMDLRMSRLTGAQFELRRQEDNGTWGPLLETVTTLSDGVVEFTTLLTVDGVYQIFETVAPTGFSRPHGYWVVTWNVVTERFEFEAVGTTSLIPALRTVECAVNSVLAECYNLEPGDVVYLLGNFPTLELPSTGGLGAIGLTLIGGLTLTFVGLFYVRGKVGGEEQVAS